MSHLRRIESGSYRVVVDGQDAPILVMRYRHTRMSKSGTGLLVPYFVWVVEWDRHVTFGVIGEWKKRLGRYHGILVGNGAEGFDTLADAAVSITKVLDG